MLIVPLRKTENANNPPPQIRNRWHYPVTTLICSNIDVKASAGGRYAGYFLNTSSNSSFAIFEFAALHPVITTDSGNHHVYGRWIAGAIASTATDVSFGGAVAIATVQGSGQVKSNDFLVSVRGILDSKWAALRRISGIMDANRMKQFGEALAEPLSWCVNGANAVGSAATAPGAVYVVNPISYDPRATFTFALNQIKKQHDLRSSERALDLALRTSKHREAHKLIDPLGLAAMYHRFGRGDGSRPSDAESAMAEKVLKKKVSLPQQNNSLLGYRLELPPFLTTDCAIPSLLRLSPQAPNRFKVHSWPPELSDLTDTGNGRTGAFNVSVQTALRVSVASMFNIDTKSDINFMGYGFTSEYMSNGLPNTVIIKEYYSAGVDVHVMYSGNDVNLTVEAVAAKATMGLLNANYAVTFSGIDLSALTKLSPFVAASIGKFDVTTLNGIGLMYGEASDVLSNHGATWTPALSAVDVNLGAAEIQALCDVGANAYDNTSADAVEALIGLGE